MSTSNLPSRKSKGGGTSKTPKDGSGSGFTYKDLEQIPPLSKGLEEYVAPQELKFMNHNPNSGPQEVSQARGTLDLLYAPRFEAVDAWREARRLKPSLPLEPEVKSENVKDHEYIRVAVAERLGVFDGYSPPIVTKGNVAVSSLDGGKLSSELEKREASGSK